MEAITAINIISDRNDRSTEGVFLAEPREGARTQNVGLQQPVDRKSDHQHECHGHTETKCRLYVFDTARNEHMPRK